MQFTHVAYGGCWKCLQLWQRCSFSSPSLAASQKGFVHSFGTGIGRVTLVQSLMTGSRVRSPTGQSIPPDRGAASAFPCGRYVEPNAAQIALDSSRQRRIAMELH